LSLLFQAGLSLKKDVKEKMRSMPNEKKWLLVAQEEIKSKDV